MTAAGVPLRPIGDLVVWPVAVGTARWALVDRPDIETARQCLHAALDAGATVLDTAPAYTPAGLDGFAERLVGQVLAERSDAGRIVVVTKGGHYRAGAEFPIDGRPESIARQCRQSLTNLGVAELGLYLLHWPDPNVPLAESVGALHLLREQGLVRRIGVCNVDRAQLRSVLGRFEIDAVQNRLSPLEPGGEELVADCADAGVAFLGYSPLGGAGAAQLGVHRPELAAVATGLGCSLHQLVVAWSLARWRSQIVVVGPSRPVTARSSVLAGQIELDPESLATLAARSG